MATALAEAGAEVGITSRSLAEGEAAAAAIRSSTGRRVLSFRADVTQSADIENLVRQAEAELGAVDILVNNAGINVRGAAVELSEADFDAVVAVNLKAPFIVARAFAPRMLERRWGRIINLGSILSVIGIPGRAP
jgi:gluconate 5-dehydrogenase